MSKAIGDLFAKGLVDCGKHQLTYTQRSNHRLVVNLLLEDQSSVWVDELCVEADFSQLQITCPADLSGELKTLIDDMLSSHEFQGVSFCATGTAIEPLLSLAKDVSDAVLVLADPPSGYVLDQTIAQKLAKSAGRIYLIFDPFHDPQASLCSALQKGRLATLKCFGLGASCLAGLARMKILQTNGSAMVMGELGELLFYERFRKRKNFPLYRKGIEEALNAKGQKSRARQFRRIFRDRLAALTPEAEFEALKTRAVQDRPTMPGSWVRGGEEAVTTLWPSAGGNVWMLQRDTGVMRYMSDRWDNRTIGYEERDGVTLAQTSSLALGFVAFGGEAHIARPMPNSLPWHVTDETLQGDCGSMGMVAEAGVATRRMERAGEGMATILAIREQLPGGILDDSLPDAPAYIALLRKVARGRDNLAAWEKSFAIDRLRLGLLRGDQNLAREEAAAHYSVVARQLTSDLAELTGQSALPLVVLTQGCGFRDEGRVEALLAEGAFDIENPGVMAVVATPTYPFPLMEGTPSTLQPDSTLMVDELCDLAVASHQAGHRWYCPSLQLARLKGQEIHAEFSSMDGLVLDDGPHGFRVEGCEAAVSVIRAEVISDRVVRLELSDIPKGDALRLTYAWGHSEPRQGYAANCGSLRDRWQTSSTVLPGQVLFRYGLSGQVPVLLER